VSPVAVQPDRLRILRDAVRNEGGQWTRHRVDEMFRRTGVKITSAACRSLLAQLAEEGVLARIEQPARRYYVPTGGAS
jgi:hypothetical protein